MALRIVFMGTPDFAVPTFVEIIGQGHQVLACYTQPPRPAGRGMAPRRSPVHERAEQFGIEVRTPETLKSPEAQTKFADLGADVAVVVAYGLILPAAVLAAPVHGCLNLHASRLPRWRGAAPINRAIMAGDTDTAVCVMAMEEGLDTGAVAMAETVQIDADMTAGDLHDQLAVLGADLMARALAALERGSLEFTDQADDGATYARKIEKSETRIDWSAPAQAVHDRIRGLSPFPGAWCEVPAGPNWQRVKLLRSHVEAGSGRPGEILDDQLTIACGSGAVRIGELQRAGRGRMSAAEYLRGSALAKGMRVR